MTGFWRNAFVTLRLFIVNEDIQLSIIPLQDRRGLLVWHDFMFGCGQYPCDEQIEKSVGREAKDQLRRLRNFCSIVIWAGYACTLCL